MHTMYSVFCVTLLYCVCVCVCVCVNQERQQQSDQDFQPQNGFQQQDHRPEQHHNGGPQHHHNNQQYHAQHHNHDNLLRQPQQQRQQQQQHIKSRTAGRHTYDGSDFYDDCSSSSSDMIAATPQYGNEQQRSIEHQKHRISHHHQIKDQKRQSKEDPYGNSTGKGEYRIYNK